MMKNLYIPVCILLMTLSCVTKPVIMENPVRLEIPVEEKSPTPAPSPIREITREDKTKIAATPEIPVEESVEEDDISIKTEITLEDLLTIQTDSPLRGDEDDVQPISEESTVPMREAAVFNYEIPEESLNLDISRDDTFQISGWETSSPEEQGMDSALLANMYDYIAEKGHNFDGIMIVRNGVVVSEAIFYPHQPYHRHMLGGITRGITSLLTGIAIELHYLKGVEQSIWDFFPEIDKSKLSENKKKLKIKHLLEMSAGFVRRDFPWTPASFKPILYWVNAGGTLKEILETRMDAEPGTLYRFDSFNLQILSEIISRATAMSTQDFAYEYLFAPLEIDNYFWSARGTANYGGWYLNMSHRDIAKIGQLHLNNGMWKGRQIVPEKWIKKTLKPTQDVPGIGEVAGYQWFNYKKEGTSVLSGSYSQELGLLIDQKLLIMTTGFITDLGNSLITSNLVMKYILPAIKDDEPIKANPEALERLRNTEIIAGRYTGRGVSPLAVAGHKGVELKISGKNFFLQKNDFGWNKISLEFPQKSNEAFININHTRLPIGLDDKYRSSRIGLFEENEPFQIFAKGNWNDQGDFLIEFLYETGVIFTLKCTFDDQDIQIVRKNNYYYRNPIYVLKGKME